MSENAVEELLARQQIEAQINAYCRGVDRGDEALLKGVFWPDATVVHPPYEGGATAFCDAALEFIKLVKMSWHTVSNITIELDGDRAYTEAYFVGYHRFGNVDPAPGLIADVLLPLRQEGVEVEDHFVGGRYIKWFERRDGQWKVFHHIGFREWETWAPASDRYPIPGMGRRDHDDPSYRRA